MRGRIREVRKRDNRIVPFDETKIADAIYRAFRSVGEGNSEVCRELASAVVHFLDERFAGSVPGIEDIQDLVETVLMEMGHSKEAKAYILYRQKRAMLRETLEVHKMPPQGEGVSFDYADESFARVESAPESQDVRESGDLHSSPRTFPEVEEAQSGVSYWCKGKISAALIREADLDPDVAEEVASSVERKVLASGIRRVSTALVRELVDNELFERGYNAKLKKQAPVALPKYNLEQIIFGTDSKEGYTFPKNPSEVREIVANRILHQYSLQQVFSPSVADAHREGRVFLHRLSDPVRLARLRWDLPVPESAGEENGAESKERATGFSGAGVARRRDFGTLRNGPARESRGNPQTGPGRREAVGRTTRWPAATDDELAGANPSGPRPRVTWPGSYVDLGDFFRLLSNLVHYVSEEIRLAGLPNLLRDPALRSVTPKERARRVLERLSQMDSRPDVALEFEFDASTEPWLRALLELCRKRPRRFLVSLRLSTRFLETATETEVLPLAAELYRRGEWVEFLSPPGAESVAAFGDSASASSYFTGVLAKTTINLPRAAYRSGKDRRLSIESELEAVAELVVKGHLERRQFVQRLAANRENPLWGLLGSDIDNPPLVSLSDGTRCAVGILGLNECVKFLTGHELHQDSGAGRLGRELVRFLHEKLAQEERGLGIALGLEETANVGPLEVLERADRHLYPEMGDIDRGRRPGVMGAYTHGVRLHRAAPADPLRRLEELVPYLAFVAPAGGLVEDSPELRGCDPEVLISLLEDGASSFGWLRRVSGVQ